MRDRAIALAFASGLVCAACVRQHVALPKHIGETDVPPPTQLSLGAKVYIERCAGCHGEKGQGTVDARSNEPVAPSVVGPEALPVEPPAGARQRTMPFKTAADLVAFVRAHAPLEHVPKLGTPEALAVVAFLLDENGIETGDGQDLTEANASDVSLREEPVRGGGPP